MKHFVVILFLASLFSGMVSCSHNSIEKPDQLISKSEFVKMMVDIYLIQGINTDALKPDSIKKITQTNLYFSVLKKYSVADTVFVRSLVYYSSFPKSYEKMHLEIMNILNQYQGQYKPTERLKTREE
jgi:hypothetical protein